MPDEPELPLPEPEPTPEPVVEKPPLVIPPNRRKVERIRLPGGRVVSRVVDQR